MLRVLPRVVVLALVAGLSAACESTHSNGPVAGASAATKVPAVKLSKAELKAKEKAISVARHEVRKRGWAGLTVESANFENGLWEVVLVRLPKMQNGRATVDVSIDGWLISYTPGA